jgi:hypothetical protein
MKQVTNLQRWRFCRRLEQDERLSLTVNPQPVGVAGGLAYLRQRGAAALLGRGQRDATPPLDRFRERHGLDRGPLAHDWLNRVHAHHRAVAHDVVHGRRLQHGLDERERDARH